MRTFEPRPNYYGRRNGTYCHGRIGILIAEARTTTLARRCQIQRTQKNRKSNVAAIPPLFSLLIEASSIAARALIYTGILGGILMSAFARPLQFGPKDLPASETNNTPTISEQLLNSLTIVSQPIRLPAPSGLRLSP